MLYFIYLKEITLILSFSLTTLNYEETKPPTKFPPQNDIFSLDHFHEFSISQRSYHIEL